MRSFTVRTLLPMVALTATALLSVACAAQTAPASTAEPTDEPTAAVPLLSTGHPVTVIDDGSGAVLCLGAVTSSLPPGCYGPRLDPWDWAGRQGDYEEASGVRWGSFFVTGEYDAGAFAFTPVEVVPAADHISESSPTGVDVEFTTRCPEPEGGWQGLDDSMVGEDDYYRVLERAAGLPGYSSSWVDRSLIPVDPNATVEQQLAETAAQPLLEIINVRVVGDPAVAEAELRTIWSGMLCVTEAERTEAELQEIADLEGAQLEHALAWGIDTLAEEVTLQVVYDEDDSLQAEMDEKHGPGVVRVLSSLEPVD